MDECLEYLTAEVGRQSIYEIRRKEDFERMEERKSANKILEAREKEDYVRKELWIVRQREQDAFFVLERQLTDKSVEKERSQVDDMILGAAEKQKSQDMLLSTVIHDLKNPLQCIALAAELINGSKEKDEIQEMTNLISISVNTMSELIEQLLLTESFKYGIPIKLNIQFLNIYECIKDSVLIQLPPILEKGAHLSYQAERGSVLCLFFDRMLVMRTMLNLLDNAVKYTPAGGHLSVSLTEEPDKVVISISDEGPGIPAKMCQKIFEPYCKLDKEKEGHGLGLHIAQKIIEAHGGRIWVEVASPKGSTFSFTLPKGDHPVSV